MIRPKGSEWASYKIDSDALTGVAKYDLKLRFYAQMVPVNLIGSIAVGGFEYGLSPREIARRVVAGKHLLWEQSLSIDMNAGE